MAKIQQALPSVDWPEFFHRFTKRSSRGLTFACHGNIAIAAGREASFNGGARR
jgi:hypothetical protein